MSWEEYLKSKKIDSVDFKKNQSELWHEWKVLFEQVHPNSFTAQKLYLINPIRRKFQLKSEDKSTLKGDDQLNISKPKVVKPKMSKPKPVFKKPKL